MPHTPGQSPLPAVPHELEVVDQALAVGSGRGIDVRLLGEQAHRSAVLAALKTHEWAHLACHGDQSWFQPGKGAVYLHDGKLTVQEIGAQQAPNADLAFLSACRTAEGGVNVDDEGLTLATAIHVSGYRHVVATLWPIRDDLAPIVARAFYEGISGSGRRDANRAGEALHRALDGIRATYPDDPFLWASYVHIGP
jgi:CHAT domain-containing protein